MKTILVYSNQPSGGYKELALSMIREGRRRGWRFTWVHPDPGPGEPGHLRSVFSVLKPAGVVVTHLRSKSIHIPRGLPAVYVDCGEIPRGAVAVCHDNASFGEMAAKILLEDRDAGFAAFGFPRHLWSLGRMEAFAAAIAERGASCRKVLVKAYFVNPMADLKPIRDALLRLGRPVSIYAVTDKLAVSVLSAAESLGWRCPGDLRIVGTDDDEVLCASAPTALSSIHPDWADGGRLVVEALEAQMRGGKPAAPYLYGAAGVTRRASTRPVYLRPKDERVERALAFIAAEYASPVGVADVARAMDCSRRLAELRFREEIGKTIAEAVEDARLDRVRVLLRRRDADLASIPRLCGFRTASALRAAFRRRTGLSMTAWRAANVPEPGQ